MVGKLDWTVAQSVEMDSEQEVTQEELASDVQPVSSQALAEKIKVSSGSTRHAKKKEPAV